MLEIPKINIQTELGFSVPTFESALAPVLLRSLATVEYGNYFVPGTRLVLEPNPKAVAFPGQLNNIIVFSGPTAVGKDYLAKLFSKKSGLPIVGFGETLAKVVGVDRDQLRMIDASELTQYYGRVIDDIIQQQPCILTSHPVFLNEGVIHFAPDIYAQLKPSYFVIISALPSQLLLWLNQRNISGERNSPPASFEEVDLLQGVSFAILKIYAEQTGSGLISIQNSPPDTDVNLNFLVSALNLTNQL